MTNNAYLEVYLVNFVTPVTPWFLANNKMCNTYKALRNKGYRVSVTQVTPVTPKK